MDVTILDYGMAANNLTEIRPRTVLWTMSMIYGLFTAIMFTFIASFIKCFLLYDQYHIKTFTYLHIYSNIVTLYIMPVIYVPRTLFPTALYPYYYHHCLKLYSNIIFHLLFPFALVFLSYYLTFHYFWASCIISYICILLKQVSCSRSYVICLFSPHEISLLCELFLATRTFFLTFPQAIRLQISSPFFSQYPCHFSPGRFRTHETLSIIPFLIAKLIINTPLCRISNSLSLYRLMLRRFIFIFMPYSFLQQIWVYTSLLLHTHIYMTNASCTLLYCSGFFHTCNCKTTYNMTYLLQLIWVYLSSLLHTPTYETLLSHALTISNIHICPSTCTPLQVRSTQRFYFIDKIPTNTLFCRFATLNLNCTCKLVILSVLTNGSCDVLLVAASYHALSAVDSRHTCLYFKNILLVFGSVTS